MLAVGAGIGYGLGSGFYGDDYYGGGYAPAYYGGYAPYGGGYAATGYEAGPEVATSGEDVAYCVQRFRSYDRRTGTYLGNDGLRHACP